MNRLYATVLCFSLTVGSVVTAGNNQCRPQRDGERGGTRRERGERRVLTLAEKMAACRSLRELEELEATAREQLYYEADCGVDRTILQWRQEVSDRFVPRYVGCNNLSRLLQLADFGIDLDSWRHGNGRDLLEYAVQCGAPSIVRYCVERCVVPRKRLTKLLSSMGGYGKSGRQTGEVLIAAGADVHDKAVLEECVWYPEILLDPLLAAGVTDEEIEFLPFRMIECGCSSLTYWLGREDSSPDARDRKGRSLLMCACNPADVRSQRAIPILLRAGASLDYRTSRNGHLLHWLAEHSGDLATFEDVLRREELDPAARDCRDYTPLDYAVARGQRDMVARLLAEPHVDLRDGKTERLARSKGRIEIGDMLCAAAKRRAGRSSGVWLAPSLSHAGAAPGAEPGSTPGPRRLVVSGASQHGARTARQSASAHAGTSFQDSDPTCSICHNDLPDEPCRVACGHRFCSDCILSWVGRKGRAAPCPKCQQPIGTM